MAERTRAELLWRFFVRGDSGCWMWTGRLNEFGYGRYGQRLAHRVMYELIVGPIPTGLELDHLCRVRACVNPAHLEPVDHTTNVKRGHGNGRKTHCPSGHAYTPENTAVTQQGRRVCRECQRVHNRAYYARKKKRSGLPV